MFFYQYVCSLGIEPTTFCAADAMLYHWATGTLFSILIRLIMYRLSVLHNSAPEYVYNLVWFSSTCNSLVNLQWLFDKCYASGVDLLRLHTNTAVVQLTNSTSPHWVLQSSHQGPLFPTAPASQVYLSLKLNQALWVNRLMNVCCASARAMLFLVWMWTGAHWHRWRRRGENMWWRWVRWRWRWSRCLRWRSRRRSRNSETLSPRYHQQLTEDSFCCVFFINESEFTLLVWFRLFSCSGVMNRWRRTWRLSIRSWRRRDVSSRRRSSAGRPNNACWSSRNWTLPGTRC